MNKSGDGLINFDEFTKMLANLIQVPIVNEEVREEVFQKFDMNHDSKISFNELQMVLYGRC